jgi:hypothetical protein
MQNVNANVANAATQTASVESANAAQTEVFAEGTEKQFSVQVKRVQLFDSEDIVNVQLMLNKAIPGFTKTDDGDFVAADVNVVSLIRSALTKQLCDIDEAIAMLRDGQKTPFSRAQFSTLLHGAAITISRVFHKAGYVRENGEAIERDQWHTTIEAVKMTEFAKNLVQQVIIQRMMNDEH